MSRWIFEIDATPVAVCVSLVDLRLRGIGPKGEPPILDASQDLVELDFIYREGIVLAVEFIGSAYKVEADAIVGPDHSKAREPLRSSKPESFCKKLC